MIALQTGFLSLFLPVCLTVLMTNGWRREIAGDVPLPAVLAVLGSGMLAAGVPLEAGERLTASADQAVYAFAALAAFVPDRDGQGRLAAAAVVPLIAAAHHWPFALERLAGRMPLQPEAACSLLSGLIAGFLVSRPERQFAVLWLGLSAAVLWRQHLTETMHVHLGGRGFLDALWLSFLCTRSVSVLLGWMQGGIRRMRSRYK